MNGVRVTNNVKEIKFKGVWGKLKAKICFQRKLFAKYLRLTVVFMCALREKFNFCVSRVFSEY